MTGKQIRIGAGIAVVIVAAIVVFGVVHERRAAEAARALAAAERAAAERAREDTKRVLEQARSVAQQQMQALSDQRAALEQSKTAAEQQVKSLNDAVEATTRQQREQSEKARRAQHLMAAVSTSQSLKVAVAEHYQSAGNWPSNNKAAGVPAPEAHRNDIVRAAYVEPYGNAGKSARVRIRYVDPTASERELHLIASANDAQVVSWQCQSPDQPDIGELVTSCVYRPRGQ